METKTTSVAPALKAMLEHFIDYAGIFPPATVPLDEAVNNYGGYKRSEYSWMLRWLVVNAGDVEKIPGAYQHTLSVLAVADQTRVAALETKEIVFAQRPVYCEVAVTELHKLAAVKKAECFAKIRTGGVTPQAIPKPELVAEFILTCASLRLAFKATAGLHHPVRAMQKLSYDEYAPQAVMHGFINVIMASAFAYCGEKNIVPILCEQDASAFKFDEGAHWRDKSLSLAQIVEARKNFIHSVGSCSFDEPVEELKAFGWLS